MRNFWLLFSGFLGEVSVVSFEHFHSVVLIRRVKLSLVNQCAKKCFSLRIPVHIAIINATIVFFSLDFLLDIIAKIIKPGNSFKMEIVLSLIVLNVVIIKAGK